MSSTASICVSCKKTLDLEPLAKTVNPVVAWQALLSHAEAMTALCIDVQFDRVTSGPPLYFSMLAFKCGQCSLKSSTQLISVRQKGQHLSQGHVAVPLHYGADIYVTCEF